MPIIWNPQHEHLLSKISHAADKILIICPFVQKQTLKLFLDEMPKGSSLQVISDWNAENIVSGVLDIGIFELTQSYPLELFHHPQLHAKIYIFNESSAFVTSGNVTSKGLGLIDSQNIEAGVEIPLEYSDWQRILTICNDSIKITPEIHSLCVQYKEDNPLLREDLPALIFPSKSLSINTLPSTEDPSVVIKALIEEHDSKNISDIALLHDLEKYSSHEKGSVKNIEQSLLEFFLSIPLVQQLLMYLKDQQDIFLRFGEIASWLHDNCDDNPTPYRSDVKMKIRVIYRWLEHFLPNHITIIWKDGKGSDMIKWTDE